MRVTTDHPASSFGQPIILDDAGNPMDYAPGVLAIRRTLDLSRGQLAAACGVHPRTVEGWEQGRRAIPAAALNVLGSLLRAAAKRKPRRPVNSPDTADPS